MCRKYIAMLFLIVILSSVISGADPLQIWRNKSTSTDVAVMDNDGNFNFNGVISGNGSGLTDLQIDVASVNYWKKNGNKLFYNDGNVGVGTDNPEAKLHVVDEGTPMNITLNLNNRIKVRGDGVLTWGNSADSGTLSWGADYAWVGAQPGKNLRLSGEIVSIGDMNPEAGLKLDVEGSIGATEYCDENGNNCQTMNQIIEGGKWNVSGSNMYPKDLGLNVGIGTVSPHQKLEVNGNINSTGNIYLGSSGASVYTDASHLYLRPASGKNYFMTSGVDNYLFTVGSAAQQDYISQHYSSAGNYGRIETGSGDLRFGSNGVSDRMILDENGNVGIGIAPSTEKFKVQGQDVAFYSGTTTNNFYVGRSQNERLKTYVTDLITYINLEQDESSGPHGIEYDIVSPSLGEKYYLFKTAGSIVAKINQSSINSNVPIIASDVCAGEVCLSDVGAGNVNASDSDTLDGYDSSFFMPLNKSVEGDFNFNGGWTDNGVSIIGGNLYAQSGYFYDINSLQVSTLTVNGSMIPPSGFDNQFDLGSSSLRWRDGFFGRDVDIGGKVGIGTTNPKAKLEVKGGHTTTKLRLHADTGQTGKNNNSILSLWASEPGVSYYGAGIGENINGHPHYGVINGERKGTALRFDDGSFRFDRYSEQGIRSESMKIDSDGNVGIGDTNPDGSLKLDVEGPIGATQYCDNNGQNCQTINQIMDGGKWNVSGSNLYPKDLNLNVGVATDAPHADLDIRGTARTRVLEFNHPTDANSMRYNTRYASTGLGWGLETKDHAGEVRMWLGNSAISNSDVLINPAVGNVGIGVTSPGVKLDVGGSIRLGSGGAVPHLILKRNGYNYIQASEAEGTIAFLTAGKTPGDANSQLVLRNDGVSYFQGGNVGIGTAGPETKLDIVGSNAGIKSNYAKMQIEDVDAQLDLTSSNGGTWGSAINLIEGAGASNTNVWSIARETTNAENDLHFNFGTLNQHNNPTMMELSTGGILTATKFVGDGSGLTGIQAEGHYKATIAGVNKDTWTKVAYVSGKGLGANIELALGGTMGSVVVESTFDIIVSHSGDIYIESMSNAYTMVDLRITSNGDDDFFIEVKLVTSATGSLSMAANLVSRGDDTVEMNPAAAVTGGTVHLHRTAKLKKVITGVGDNDGPGFVAPRIGIGTDNPDEKLEVVGKIQAGTAGTSASSYNNGIAIHNPANTPTSLFMWQDGQSSAQIGFPSGSSTLHLTNSYDGGQITDPHSMVIDRTGNVGIGKVNPVSKLEIYDAPGSAFKTALNFQTNAATGGGSAIFFKGSGNVALDRYGAKIGGVRASENNGATDFKIELENPTASGMEEVFRIRSGGNVGIGDTTPLGKLDVEGTTRMMAPGIGSTKIDKSNYALILGSAATRSATAGTYYGGIAFSQLLKHNGDSGVYDKSPQAWIGTKLSSTSGSELASLVFATKPGTGYTETGNDIPIERMRIEPGGDIYFTGKLYGDGSGLTGVTIDTSDMLKKLSGVSVTGSNPFDDAHAATKVADNGFRTISYTGASAAMLTFNAGGSASVVQLGSHYDGNNYYLRTRTDASNWKTWKKIALVGAGSVDSRYVAVAGDTMTGPLVMNNNAYINMNRAGGAKTGIQWYNSAHQTWATYMAPPGTGNGPKGTLTSPSGDLVTSWALRNYIENVGGYGWTFESGTSSDTTPNVVAEIRASDGSMQIDGDMTVAGNDLRFVSQGGLHKVGSISFTSGTAWDNADYHGIMSKNNAGSFGDDIRINSYDDVSVNLDTNNNDGASEFTIQEHSTGDGNNIFKIDSPSGDVTVQGKLLSEGDTLTVSDKLNVVGTITADGELRLDGSSPQVRLQDSDGDDFWIHANSNNFYVLADRDDSGSWDGAHPLQLESDTNKAYTFGNEILTTASSVSASTISGSTTDLNSIPNTDKNLYYQRYSASASNKPVSSNNANGVLTMTTHSGPYGKQLAWGDTDDLYMRRITNNAPASWKKILKEGDSLSANVLDSNVGVGGNFLTWDASGGMKRVTTQGGAAMYADSSLLFHAGDGIDTVVSTMGISAGTTTENLHLTSDGEVQITTGLQTIASRKTSKFTAAGNLDIPGRLDISGNNYLYSDDGYIGLKSGGNEMVIGGNDGSMYVNYRSADGGTPTNWYWKDGSSTSWANHNMGQLGINSPNSGNYNEGIRIAKASNNFATIALGNDIGSTSGTGDGIWSIHRDASGKFQIRENGAQFMNIDKSGNVGFGDDTPENRLDVEGKLGATDYCDNAGNNCRNARGSMRATSNYDEYLVNLASNDLTIEEIASYLGTSTSGMTKCDDPTAPEEGCFQVSGPKYTDLTGPFLKVDEASEYIFEVWIKVQSSTTSTQRFYAGWGMYNSAKSYFGNTRRYWGCSGSQFDSDSNNDGQWHLVRGRISGSGSSTGQFVPGTEYAKFLLLMNYNSGNTVTRYAGMKLYKSREVITSMYLKDSGIDISTGSATDKMLIDTSGNMYPNEVRGSNGNVVIRIG